MGCCKCAGCTKKGYIKRVVLMGSYLTGVDRLQLGYPILFEQDVILHLLLFALLVFNQLIELLFLQLSKLALVLSNCHKTHNSGTV